MPAAIKAAIIDAVITMGGKTEEEAKAFLRMMQIEGRLVEECWS